MCWKKKNILRRLSFIDYGDHNITSIILSGFNPMHHKIFTYDTCDNVRYQIYNKNACTVHVINFVSHIIACIVDKDCVVE